MSTLTAIVVGLLVMVAVFFGLYMIGRFTMWITGQSSYEEDFLWPILMGVITCVPLGLILAFAYTLGLSILH